MKRRGFTLIEMILTIGLVAVLSGVGFASTLRSNEQKKVSESAETLRQYYLQAKSLAQAGKKDCLACGSSDGVCGNGDSALSGWRTVANATSPVTFEMHGECGAISFFSSGVKSLPNNVILTLTGSGNILFYPLNMGTSLGGTTTVRISSNMSGIVAKSFTVSSQGEVSSIF